MIEMSIILAALFFAWGAFIMMTARDSETQITKGRETITIAVFGAVIALSAWVIVGTIMQFLSGSPSKLPWSEIQCVVEKAAIGKTAAAVSSSQPSQNTALNEQEIRNQLNQAGITINKNACPTGTSYQNVAGGCTSLEGVQASTMTAVIRLKQNCNCPIEITGGTEQGHATGVDPKTALSHAKGYKLDFRPNPSLDQYIQKNFTPMAKRSDNAPQYRAADGTIMAKEGDHWDATFAK